MSLSFRSITTEPWTEQGNSYDFRNKQIGVIGNGSSAIQIVPSLQKIEGAQLSCFVRSKTWITNPFGDGKLNKHIAVILSLWIRCSY